MTDKNLLNIRNRYNELLGINKNLEQILEIKKEMETDEKIKEYMNVLKALEIYQNALTKNGKILNQDEILEKVMEEENITNTNQIYVYQCSYAKDPYRNNHQSRGYYRVAVDDSRAEYHVYLDIEKDYKSAYIEISSSERENFEENNHVIYPKNCFPFDCYMKTRKLFFETVLNGNQEEAIQKVLKKLDLR